MVILFAMPADASKLQTLYVKSAIAKAVLDHFAERQNNASETTLDTMVAVLTRQGIEVSRSAMVEVFRDLDTAGAGEFIVGRKGHPSRFLWQEDSSLVGKRARTPSSTKDRAATPPQQADRPALQQNFVEHPFMLRPGVTVSFALPADLSQGEASRLADFLKTLPFDR